MPIDWSDVDDHIDAIAEKAKGKTDDELAGKVSSLLRLTDDDVKTLFPTAADVAKLSQLMQIVKAADDRNTKVKNLMDNIESLAGTVVTLVGKVA